MSGTIWRIEDPEPNPTPPGVVPGSWVSLHYLRSTLQRRWRVVAATAAAGLMVALVALFALPTSATASATVLLAHDPAVDPATALATDQSLLETRIVAQKVIDELHLGLSPDDFLSTFTPVEISTQVLQIDLKAPTAQEAVDRLSSLSQKFLEYRNERLKTQADAIVTADQATIATLQGQVADLGKRYNTAAAAGEGQLATDLLAQQSQLSSQIATLQQTIQATTIQADSLAAASQVVDPAAAVPASGKKRIALGVMSGLILGAAVGGAVVFAQALISNSLRRREEVATALGRPVSFSAGRVRGRMPWGRRGRQRNLEVLATGLLSALPDGRDPNEHLALLGVGDLSSAAMVLMRAGRLLQESGEQVFLVDLTTQRWLAGTPHGDLPLYHPEERPQLSDGPLSLVASARAEVPEGNPLQEEWDRADVVLVLGEVDLGVGTGHLSTWTERVVLLVGAGKATAELLRSISRTLTRTGPQLEFAMLVGADRTDESVGIPRRVAPEEQRRGAR